MTEKNYVASTGYFTDYLIANMTNPTVDKVNNALFIMWAEYASRDEDDRPDYLFEPLFIRYEGGVRDLLSWATPARVAKTEGLHDFKEALAEFNHADWGEWLFPFIDAHIGHASDIPDVELTKQVLALNSVQHANKMVNPQDVIDDYRKLEEEIQQLEFLRNLFPA